MRENNTDGSVLEELLGLGAYDKEAMEQGHPDAQFRRGWFTGNITCM